MYHFVPPTVMVAGGRCVWVTSAVLVDVRAHIVPLKSFLAPYLLLSRRFCCLCPCLLLSGMLCCCSCLVFSLLLLLSSHRGFSPPLLLLSLCIFFPLLLLLLLPKLCPPLPFCIFPLSSIVGFFAPSSSLDTGLNDSDRIVIVKIRSIDVVFCLLHATFLLLQLDFLRGQPPLLQILSNFSLLRLSPLVRLRSLFGSCDTGQVLDLLLQSPNRSLQLGYRRLEIIPLYSPLGSTFFFLLSKYSDPSDFIVCLGN
jgi:hypothetical protein